MFREQLRARHRASSAVRVAEYSCLMWQLCDARVCPVLASAQLERAPWRLERVGSGLAEIDVAQRVTELGHFVSNGVFITAHTGHATARIAPALHALGVEQHAG